ncbi:MAG: cadmium-translocating P-type ATPase [Flavipsychrobacter sp.]|nr:cadmium-translocating P-type ATPase [Flavipsychrobacter sp.]
MEKAYSAVVEGMTCGNCAITITKLLEKKGVNNISANAASGEVNFTAPEALDVEVVYDAIDGMGYHVVREGAAEGNRPAHDHKDNTTVFLIINLVLTLPLLAHMFTSWHVLHMPWVQFALATPVFAIGCYVFLPSAYRSLVNRIPNMDVLIMIGATAAYVYSLIGLLFFPATAHDFIFFETTASIITLVMVGNWLEHKTVKSTTVAIDELVKLQPQMARIIMADSLGKETILEVESRYVRNDDVVLVNNGDSIPVDGEIVQGEAQIDEHMITGESVPAHKRVGDGVVGGTLVVDGNLKVKATAVGNASVLASIIKMVREAQAVKPALQKLADKISAVFVPLVLGVSLLTLLVNWFVVGVGFTEAMMRAIAVLVISCPCAMGLATPAAVAVGLGRAARNGILVKGGDTLEQLKRIKQIVFDKTGTLTTGQLEVSAFHTVLDEARFRAVVVAIEQHSSHPIAKSVSAQWSDALPHALAEVHEVKGKGMQASDAEGNTWKLGSERWLQPSPEHAGADLYLYRNDAYAGSLTITDKLRDDAKTAVAELKEMGYTLVLLSGDKKAKCEQIGAELGLDIVYAEQSPAQKDQILDMLLQKAPTAMVGDGINDAPALARATVGISLSESTQIAIQSANVILSNNQLLSLPKAIRLGIYTEQTIKQNLFWAFLYNIVAIPIAAVGLLKPVWGAGIMALSDVVLIINSLRLGIRRINRV